MKLGLERLWSVVAYGFRGDPSHAADALWPIVLPLLIGSLVLGLVSGVAAYYSLVHFLERLHARRRAHLALRFHERRLPAV